MAAVLMAALCGVGLAVVAWTRLAQTRRRESHRVTFRLHFPRDVTAEQVAAFLGALSGRVGETFTFEVAATADGVVHRLVAPSDAADYVADQLRAAIPGVRALVEDEGVDCAVGFELRLTSHATPLRTSDPVATCTALLASIAAGRDSGLVAQLTVTPKRRAPRLVAARAKRTLEDRMSDAIGDLILNRRTVATSDELRHLAEKASAPLFHAALRIGVSAPQQGELAGRVVAALGGVRAPGAEFRQRQLAPRLVGRRIAMRRIPSFVWPILVNATEITALIAWPLGSPIVPGVTLGGAPHLPPARALPESGLVLGRADFPGMERQVAIGVPDVLRHLYLPGPTGVGKSTLALNLALQEMALGYGVAVLDPKGDLVADLLDRIPLQRERDVIVVDPLDGRPVGLNLLDGPPGESDLTADQVVGVFARRFGAAWGPRSDDIARAAVLTLLTDPASTIADLPVLLSSPGFRRTLVARVKDPALVQFWQAFESWSEPERAHNTAPLLNKTRSVLMRRPVRAIVGQPSTVSLDAVLAEGKVLLVPLQAGLVGEDAAALLGGLLFARLWAAAQRRVALPPEARTPYLVTSTSCTSS